MAVFNALKGSSQYPLVVSSGSRDCKCLKQLVQHMSTHSQLNVGLDVQFMTPEVLYKTGNCWKEIGQWRDAFFPPEFFFIIPKFIVKMQFIEKIHKI